MLLTKLHKPTPGKNLVHRSNLFNKLEEGLNCKLILISAPAGSGKTTLICDWIFQNKIETAWYSTSSRDNDPKEFLSFIIHAIQTIHKEIGKNSLELIRSPESIQIDYILELLINDILKIEKNLLLVLDDFHLINNLKIFEIVKFLLQNIPDKFHIAISTRSDPPISLARIRSQNELVEIRSNDLNFTINDIYNLFNKKLKLELSIHDINILGKKTEGWIAGLQLSALSMQGRTDVSNYLKKFAGDNRYIMDYLIEEVLNIQNEETTEFLLKTSVLEIFNGSLCDSILKRTNCQLLLENLESMNMFIVPLDDERKWFRYHHLFADLLKFRLKSNFKTSINEIHHKASLWFENNEMTISAIEHALESVNYDRAMKLLHGIVESLWEDGQYSTISNFGKAFPEKIIKQNSRFCVHYAWTLVLFGDLTEAEKYLNYLETSFYNNKEIQDSANENMIGKVYHTLTILKIFSRNINAAFEYSEKALKNLNESDHLWNTWAVIGHGELSFCKLDLKSSKEAFVHAKKLSNEVNNNYLNIISTVDLANVLRLEGKYGDLIEMCNEFIAKADNNSNGTEKSLEILTCLFHSTLGLVLTELNNIDDGVNHVLRGLELSKKVEGGTWFVYCALLAAETFCKLEDIQKAFQIVQEIEINEKIIPQKLSGSVFALRFKLLVLNDDLDKASELLKESINRGDIVNKYANFYFNLSKVRFYISNYNTSKAISLLNELSVIAKKNNANEMLIEIELLKARSYFRDSNKTDAINSVISALFLAQEEAFIRIFLSEGEDIKTMIKEIHQEKLTKTSNSLDLVSKKYLEKLILAYGCDAEQKTNAVDNIISKRELDTLKLIAENFTNQEIANRLFISLNTVKTHLKNINIKLEANNRAEAVIRAKEIGVL